MGRKASVRYYDSRGAYFTHYQGKQHKLAEGPDDAPAGPTYLKALGKFRELMELTGADRGEGDPAFFALCELYGRFLEERGRLVTLRLCQDMLASAVAEFGARRVSELRAFHVERWLQKQSQERTDSRMRKQTWGETTKRTALDQLRRVLRWGQKMGHLEDNPLADLSEFADIRKASRGQEAVVSPGTYRTLLDDARPSFRDLLVILWETGCRPGEAYHAEARNFHPADKCIVFPGKPGRGEWAWKNARRTGKDRILYLSDAALGVVARLAAARPTGPLLRTQRGTPFSLNTVNRHLQHTTERLKLPDVAPYHFRHTFATTFLQEGGSIKVLADLLGTSVKMLDTHYSHLQIDRGKMRQIMVAVMMARGT